MDAMTELIRTGKMNIMDLSQLNEGTFTPNDHGIKHVTVINLKSNNSMILTYGMKSITRKTKPCIF